MYIDIPIVNDILNIDIDIKDVYIYIPIVNDILNIDIDIKDIYIYIYIFIQGFGFSGPRITKP